VDSYEVVSTCSDSSLEIFLEELIPLKEIPNRVPVLYGGYLKSNTLPVEILPLIQEVINRSIALIY